MLFPGTWHDHPERADVVVFFYKTETFAAHFCGLLKEAQIYFEYYEPLPDDSRHCVAVYRRDFARSLKLHESTLAKLKKPFISDPALRWTVIILFLLLLGLAVAGAVITNFRNGQTP